MTNNIYPRALDLSIIIPCIDEAKNLQELLPLVKSFIGEDVAYEIIVVDGGSQDNTMLVAEGLGAIPIKQKGKGYGNALNSGFANARGEYILTMDADLSHHPSLIPNMFKRRHEADVLVASRYITRGYSKANFSRQLISWLANQSFKHLIQFPVNDVSSGFRIYRRDAIKSIEIKNQNYNALQEILLKLYANGETIKEIPFHYRHRQKGKSKAKFLRFGLEYLLYLPVASRLRNSIVTADYDERAFHSRNPLQRYWQRKRYDIIVEAVGNAKEILDVGSGSSMIMEALPHAISLDIRLNILRFKADSIRPLIQGSVFSLPFEDEQFDCLIFSQVIEHLPKDDMILDECVRVLKPGGKLIFGTPDYGSWQWPMFEWAYDIVHPEGYVQEHITHFTLESSLEELQRRGLKIEYYKYILKAELIIVATKKQ